MLILSSLLIFLAQCCISTSDSPEVDNFTKLNNLSNGTDDYTGEITTPIKKLAKSIVGDSKDIVAAKKLAKWVSKNIKHETAPGFYQSPEVTLKRKIGNCCSKTDLFLQMCVAVGVNKKHKLYYVHVGTMKFHKRHFFAMIDNTVVDVDGPKNPWGHANIGKNKVYQITEYPYLPLPRKY